jgi:hypothetical protein
MSLKESESGPLISPLGASHSTTAAIASQARSAFDQCHRIVSVGPGPPLGPDTRRAARSTRESRVPPTIRGRLRGVSRSRPSLLDRAPRRYSPAPTSPRGEVALEGQNPRFGETSLIGRSTAPRGPSIAARLRDRGSTSRNPRCSPWPRIPGSSFLVPRSSLLVPTSEPA